MNVDKNLIRHWANLFESEEAMRSGEEPLAEATYNSTTADEIRQRIKGNDDNAWVEGKGEDFAIYFELPRYHSPVDVNGYEFDDDGYYERYLGSCEDKIERILHKAGLPENEFEKELAYYNNEYGEKVSPDNAWKAEYESTGWCRNAIHPKRTLDTMRKRPPSCIRKP